MKIKHKRLNAKNLKEFLESHHGRLVDNNYSSHCNYYECDDNILVIENTLAKDINIFYDREKVYEEERKIQERKNFNPLKNSQDLIFHLEDHKHIVLNELFDSLKMIKESTLSNVDLDSLNKAIKKYGYQNVIDKLYLNLVVFAGEYIREKYGGQWTIDKDRARPTQFEPIFRDSKNRDYRFEINYSILKSFNESRRLNMKQILEFALLPKLKVLPNPFEQKF